MRIQILLYDGFNELDALGPLDVLQVAGARGADLRAELTRLGSATVTSARGLTLHVRSPLESVPSPSLLVVPGGGSLERGDHAAWVDMHRSRLAAAIQPLHAGGAVLAAVSTGALVLAAADLLRGRPAAALPACAEELRSAGAELVAARVVADGDIVTSAGATSGIDLALWLVERFAGPAVAHEVEQRLEYERRGTVWRRRR